MKKSNTFKAIKLIAITFLVSACSTDDINEQTNTTDAILAGDVSTLGDASFTYPTDVAVDQNGDVYVTDVNRKVVKKISVADGSNAITIIAGNDVAQSIDGIGTAASFYFPQTLTFSSDYTTLYVGTWSNIRAIDMATMQVTTIAATEGFAYPKDIVLNNAGTSMYVSENVFTTTHIKRIKKIDLATEEVTTMSWNNLPDSFSPQHMIVDSNDENLYLASTNVILKMNLQTNDVTVLVGSNTQSGTVDGIGEDVRLHNVYSLAFSENETYLYFVNGSGAGTRALRAVNMSTNEVTSVITTAGYELADGAPGTAMFKDLKGTAFNSDYSRLYVVDQYNNAVRYIE